MQQREEKVVSTWAEENPTIFRYENYEQQTNFSPSLLAWRSPFFSETESSFERRSRVSSAKSKIMQRFLLGPVYRILKERLDIYCTLFEWVHAWNLCHNCSLFQMFNDAKLQLHLVSLPRFKWLFGLYRNMYLDRLFVKNTRQLGQRY